MATPGTVADMRAAVKKKTPKQAEKPPTVTAGTLKYGGPNLFVTSPAVGYETPSKDMAIRRAVADKTPLKTPPSTPPRHLMTPAAQKKAAGVQSARTFTPAVAKKERAGTLKASVAKAKPVRRVNKPSAKRRP